MSKILVIGGGGFVGSYVIRSLLRQQHELTLLECKVPVSDQSGLATDPVSRLADVASEIEFIVGDAFDQVELHTHLSEIRPDALIHLAAPPVVQFANDHPVSAAHSIISGTQVILDVMRQVTPRCRAVIVSSSMVYGDFLSALVDETHPTNPTNLYGTFKLASELISRAYASCYELDVTIVRPTAVYGPRDSNDRVVGKWIRRAMSGQTLLMDGDGSLTLDFTFVEDCANGIASCATHPQAGGQIFNIARGQARSLRDLAIILGSHFPGLRIETRSTPQHVPKRGTLDIQKARNTLGFCPEISLEEGVNRYINHLRSNNI